MSATLREIRVQGALMVALVGLLFLHAGRESTALPVALVTWFLTCVMVESLWHPALRGRAVISMAPAAHLAALVALPITWGTPLVMAATAGGAILWRRHDPGRALLRGASAGLGAVIVVGLLSSTHTFALDGFVGGPQDLLNHPRQFLAFVIGGFLYLAITQGIEVFAVSRELRVSLVTAWRQSYGRETELVTSVALVTVAFLVLFCYHAIGYRGLLLCVMPLLFVRDGSRRNLELAQAQSQLIENERLAAKGEMAAEIGHELNNYLAAISGRAQLLLRKLGPDADRDIQEQATLVHQTSGRMAELAKGLMDFSHRDVKRTAVGLNDLVDRTVEFIRPQTRFRALTFAFSPGEHLPPVEMDPGQIQQVLLTLFGRVADAGTGPVSRRLVIRTFADERGHAVGIEIRSPRHPGPDASGDGADPMLGTVRRIVERHQGRFETHNDGEDDETYRVLLPAA